MEKSMKKNRLNELSQFLRLRRHRLTPTQVGLSEGTRRRIQGLRREEVAMLAGLSVDWYTWLEQGRDIQVSAEVLESIARALRLNSYERKHLFLLANRPMPLNMVSANEQVSATLQNFLSSLHTSPAIVTDQKWNVVAWNQSACVVYGDYASMSDLARNTVWRTFTSLEVRDILQNKWKEHARRRLAQFRANYAKYVGDIWWTEMIDKLNDNSDEFRAWWPQHEVFDTPEGNKILYHPLLGKLSFEHISFQVSDVSELLVTINTPIDDQHQTKQKMQNLFVPK